MFNFSNFFLLLNRFLLILFLVANFSLSYADQIKIQKVKTGEKVFDWTIPKEWEIDEAYIICPDGKKICDFSINNLHVVGYSIPVNKKLDLAPYISRSSFS